MLQTAHPQYLFLGDRFFRKRSTGAYKCPTPNLGVTSSNLIIVLIEPARI
jgi:hypothetical protein